MAYKLMIQVGSVSMQAEAEQDYFGEAFMLYGSHAIEWLDKVPSLLLMDLFGVPCLSKMLKKVATGSGKIAISWGKL